MVVLDADGFVCRQGLGTQFVELPINVSDAKLWEGVRLRYWQLDTYYLPVVQHDDDDDEDDEADVQERNQADTTHVQHSEQPDPAKPKPKSNVQTQIKPS